MLMPKLQGRPVIGRACRFAALDFASILHGCEPGRVGDKLGEAVSATADRLLETIDTYRTVRAGVTQQTRDEFLRAGYWSAGQYLSQKATGRRRQVDTVAYLVHFREVLEDANQHYAALGWTEDLPRPSKPSKTELAAAPWLTDERRDWLKQNRQKLGGSDRLRSTFELAAMKWLIWAEVAPRQIWSRTVTENAKRLYRSNMRNRFGQRLRARRGNHRRRYTLH